MAKERRRRSARGEGVVDVEVSDEGEGRLGVSTFRGLKDDLSVWFSVRPGVAESASRAKGSHGGGSGAAGSSSTTTRWTTLKERYRRLGKEEALTR